MKKMILASMLLLSFVAQAGEVADVSAKQQLKIIEELLDSKVAKDTYPEGAEASYSDIMERDVRMYLAGQLNEGSKVVLGCSEMTTDKFLCALHSNNRESVDGTILESSMIITGEVTITRETSKKGKAKEKISVSNVKVEIAG